MEAADEWTREDKEQALRETRQKLEAIEREWKHWRAQSRALCIDLIDQERVSVAKVASISGHHRNTLTSWLQVHNAEQKGRQKAK